MKYRIGIGDQIFSVEVGDLHARPVQVIVDGDIFEVWPEELGLPYSAVSTEPAVTSQPAASSSKTPSMPGSQANLAPAASPAATPGTEKTAPPDEVKALRAPIPGLIIKVSIQAGAEVSFGQELCVLEAMKMNNLIRAPRPGRIAAVHVSEGKHVKHGDLLMEYA